VTTWAIVVAGGSGHRFGAPKQFARLAGVAVVDRALATAQEACDHAVVVVPAGSVWRPPSGVAIARAGATRSDSVRAGLAAVDRGAGIVVVHDAARPLASRALFAAVIDAIRAGADAAIPAIPVVDTLKRVADGRVVETVARDGIVAVQTPQAFRAEALRAAHVHGGIDTDDAALVEMHGGTVVTVPGEQRNLKVTVAADLELAHALLDVGSAP
jgi:2-C-methyl-D-erythritol 4-phosphate cytidylyltransferase